MNFGISKNAIASTIRGWSNEWCLEILPEFVKPLGWVQFGENSNITSTIKSLIALIQDTPHDRCLNCLNMINVSKVVD